MARYLPLAALLATIASLTAAAASPAAVTIGSNLTATPNSTGCGFGSFNAVDFPCMTSQADLLSSHTAAGGLTAPIDGVIVRWRVLSGTPDPNLTGVKMRLRAFRGNAMGPAGDLVTLPLGEPGLHTYPTRLSIGSGGQIGVETLLTNKNMASVSAPIEHAEPGLGTIVYRSGGILEGEIRPPFYVQENRELLLNADMEPDADRDGYGDETQDSCPSDATTRGACPISPPAKDTTPPQTKLTYPERQDFLGGKKVLVRLRSNEDATAFASGQLEWPRGPGKRAGRVIYAVTGVKRAVKAGEKTALRLRVSKQTREAALRALANGKRIVVKVTVSATDAAGNRSGITVATIKPPR